MDQAKVTDNPARLMLLPSHCVVGNIMATSVRDIDLIPATQRRANSERCLG